MQNKEHSHPEEKKKDSKVDYTQLPAGPFWSISKIPCPSRLRDKYSEQLGEQAPLRT